MRARRSTSASRRIETAAWVITLGLFGIGCGGHARPCFRGADGAWRADTFRARTGNRAPLHKRGRFNGRPMLISPPTVVFLGTLASKLRVAISVGLGTRSKDVAAMIRIGDKGAWNGNDYCSQASGPPLNMDRVIGDLSPYCNVSSRGLGTKLGHGRIPTNLAETR